MLPTDTHLIGEGPNATTIVPSFTSGDILDMGMPSCPTPNDCPGVVIEHLGLNGNGNTGVNGIVNNYSQELSRVNDVKMVGLNVGLELAQRYSYNSGPYTNISMTAVTQCVNIGTSTAPPNTRGIHGLTCTTTGGSSNTPGIFIGGSNNTLQDIYISGGSSQDGIKITAAGNVVMNVVGSGLLNVVHLASGTSDVSLLGLTRSGGTYTVVDDLTTTTLTDSTLGMYILGEPVASGSTGYSRFTTSVNNAVPSWTVGTGTPNNSVTCGVGDLYSCTNSSNCTHTLWECTRTSGATTWTYIQ